MEFEFDNEIDTLLHRTAKGGNLTAAGNESGGHIDADEISMFAENALPETAKPRVTKHLADCGRCRMILSNVIFLNAEAESAAVFAIEKISENVVEASEPNWFQKLFATKNLAFGMGALALVFAVGIGFLVLQNVGNSEQPESAKMEVKSGSESADSAVFDTSEADKSAAEGFANSNIAVAESDANSAEAASDRESKSDAASADNETATKDAVKLSDNKSTGQPSAKAKNPESSGKLSESEEDSATDMMTRSNNDSSMTNSAAEGGESRSRLQSEPSVAAKRKSATPPSSPAKKETKTRTDESERERQMDSPKTADALAEKRQIGGKTFTRRNGVWYDSAYKGQSTTNVKRGTADYRSLDSQLRSITNRLEGTVILVWKQKGFRIQ